MLNRIILLIAISICLPITGISAEQTIKTADYHIVPLPSRIIPSSKEAFILTSGIIVSCRQKELTGNAMSLVTYVQNLNGIKLIVSGNNKKGSKRNNIELAIDKTIINPEGYRLTVHRNGILIEGSTAAGIFYGIQTLRKSLPVGQYKEVRLPAVVIEDAPRFPYRGMMLDVSRHFSPPTDIKRILDILALHNINYFHWHLTDDQGWRIEIKSRPRLTEIGSKRAGTVLGHNIEGAYDGKPYGGYYTQEEIKEIIAYAKKLHITIIPEIDMPGHMLAALASYPQLGCTGGPYSVWRKWGISKDVLCAGNDSTYKFIEDVLREVVALFPSPYIHLGGDECPKDRWKTCPKCQARIKALHLEQDGKFSPEDMLQNYLVKYAVDFLKQYGRQVIGWDEILDGKIILGTTVMSWRGEEGGNTAAKLQHNVIMTPLQYAYFDFYQSTDVEQEPLAIGNYLPASKVYTYDPVQKIDEEHIKYIKGVQANLWREYIPTQKQTEYMLLPRLAALSEVQWCRPEIKNFKDFLKRLDKLTTYYDHAHFNYARTLYEVSDSVIFDKERNGLKVKLATPHENAVIHYTLNGTIPTQSSTLYKTPFYINKNTVVKAIAIYQNKNSRIFTDTLLVSKSTGKPVQLLQPVSPEFTFGGAALLTDGLTGNSCYSTGRWIGCYDSDMEAIIDLEHETDFNAISFSTCILQSTGVFETRGVTISVSNDGKNYRQIVTKDYPEMLVNYADGVHKHRFEFIPQKVRFVKVKIRSEHSLPSWHDAKGTPGYLFVDEIIVS